MRDHRSVSSSLNNSINIGKCSSLIDTNFSTISSELNLRNNSKFQSSMNAITNEKVHLQTFLKIVNIFHYHSSQINKKSNFKTTWRCLEIFTLLNGHYFGFESTTIHAWYLTRSTVDIISSNFYPLTFRF